MNRQKTTSNKRPVRTTPADWGVSSGAREGRPFLLEPLPDEILSHLEPFRKGKAIHSCVSSDLTMGGKYGKGWLVITDRELLACNRENGKTDTPIRIELSDILKVSVKEYRGNAFLYVKTPSWGVEVLRYTKGMERTLAHLPARVRQLARACGSKAETPGLREYGKQEERDFGFCQVCGKPIPMWADGQCPSCVKRGRLIWRFLRYSLPYWRQVCVGFGIMLVGTFIGLLPPLLMKTLVDDVLAPAALQGTAQRPLTRIGSWLSGTDGSGNWTNAGRMQLLLLLVGILVVIQVSASVLQSLRGYLIAWTGQGITYDLRNSVYRHLHFLSVGFFASEETGRIISRMTRDIRWVQEFITNGFQEMVRSVLTLLIISGILFAMNWKLAFLVLLPTPVLTVLTLYFGNRLHRVLHTVSRMSAGLSAILADTIPGIRVVKAFAQEKKEITRFRDRSKEVRKAEMNGARIHHVFTPFMTLVTYLGTVIIWAVGGRNVLAGTLTLGGFMAFTNYMLRFYQPVETLCRLNHRLQHAAASAEHVFEILDTEPDVRDKDGAQELTSPRGLVEFRDVTFAYERGKPVLKKINFRVEPGEMIGLAGHSGAGKSTLINLICRFYDPQQGGIFLDGIDLRDLRGNSLRNHIGIVLQDSFLFNGTIAENISYGKPGAELDEIVEAARAANAHDFILACPDAYDTRVGERGQNLSGGERQRISIARAILKDPQILILDEATASVDTDTEAKIQEAIARLVKGRTTFAIAHRLSTLRNANRLMILEKGVLVESGSHRELMARNGVFARLCRMQTELSDLMRPDGDMETESDRKRSVRA